METSILYYKTFTTLNKVEKFLLIFTSYRPNRMRRAVCKCLVRTAVMSMKQSSVGERTDRQTDLSRRGVFTEGCCLPGLFAGRITAATVCKQHEGLRIESVLGLFEVKEYCGPGELLR